MAMRFSLASLLMLAGMIQGVILSAVLLDRKRRNFRANRYLAGLIIAMTVRLFNAFLTRSVVPGTVPVTGRFTIFLIFAFLPLLYFYVRALTEPEFFFRPAHLAHFIPAGLAFLYTVPFYAAALLAPETARSYGQSWAWETTAVNGLVLLQQLIYGIWIIRVVSSYRRRIADLVSSLERIRLSWILWLLGVLVVLTLFVFGIVIYRLAGGSSAPLFAQRDVIYSAIMALTIYAAGYFALSQPEVFSPPLARAAVKKYESSSLSPAKAEESLRLLTAMMENDALYRDENLSLPSLAEKAGLSVGHLSQVINERLGKNFYDFVNGYRVEEACRRLRDPRTRSQKIITVAFDVGFNSKAGFNRVFKKQTGLTPSAYRAKAGAA
jgi:AraC-like DNA-binding protein